VRSIAAPGSAAGRFIGQGVPDLRLSDRYTWLQEDRPRRDGAARRPLPFDANLQPKPAYDAIVQAFANAPVRDPLWVM
jgi:hypothetical protein